MLAVKALLWLNMLNFHMLIYVCKTLINLLSAAKREEHVLLKEVKTRITAKSEIHMVRCFRIQAEKKENINVKKRKTTITLYFSEFKNCNKH